MSSGVKRMCSRWPPFMSVHFFSPMQKLVLYELLRPPTFFEQTKEEVDAIVQSNREDRFSSKIASYWDRSSTPIQKKPVQLAEDRGDVCFRQHEYVWPKPDRRDRQTEGREPSKCWHTPTSRDATTSRDTATSRDATASRDAALSRDATASREYRYPRKGKL